MPSSSTLRAAPATGKKKPDDPASLASFQSLLSVYFCAPRYPLSALPAAASAPLLASGAALGAPRPRRPAADLRPRQPSRGAGKPSPWPRSCRRQASVGLGYPDLHPAAAGPRHGPEAGAAARPLLWLVPPPPRHDRGRPPAGRGSAPGHAPPGPGAPGGRSPDRDLSRGHPLHARSSRPLSAGHSRPLQEPGAPGNPGGTQFRLLLGPARLQQATGNHPSARPSPHSTGPGAPAVHG